MKKFVLALLLACLTNLYALSEISAIPSDHRLLLNKILKDLHFSDADDKSRKDIYGELKPFLKNGWYTHWISNRTGSDSKIENADTLFTDIMIYNDSRVANLTFIYFRKYNQLFVGVKESIQTSSQNALKRFRKNKSDTKLEKLNETDNYAVFNEKGYMGYETVHIKEPNAMMIYETSRYLDVYPKEVIRSLDKNSTVVPKS